MKKILLIITIAFSKDLLAFTLHPEVQSQIENAQKYHCQQNPNDLVCKVVK